MQCIMEKLLILLSVLLSQLAQSLLVITHTPKNVLVLWLKPRIVLLTIRLLHHAQHVQARILSYQVVPAVKMGTTNLMKTQLASVK